MVNGIRTGYPRGFNKGRSSKLHEGSWVRQTPEEGRRTYRPKCCGNNNKDEDNSPKTPTERSGFGGLILFLNFQTVQKKLPVVWNQRNLPGENRTIFCKLYYIIICKISFIYIYIYIYKCIKNGKKELLLMLSYCEEIFISNFSSLGSALSI